MTDECEPRDVEQRPVNHTVRGVWVLFAMLACYVLSPVPLMWGMEQLGIYDRCEPAIESFYTPLSYLCDHVEFISDFYGWQIELLDL